MTFLELFREGQQAYRDGAPYSGGDHTLGHQSSETRAWQTGWEIACADEIQSGAVAPDAMPNYSRLYLIRR